MQINSTQGLHIKLVPQVGTSYVLLSNQLAPVVKFVTILGYSNLSASTRFSRDALIAGYIPKNKPIDTEIANATIMALTDTTLGNDASEKNSITHETPNPMP